MKLSPLFLMGLVAAAAAEAPRTATYSPEQQRSAAALVDGYVSVADTNAFPPPSATPMVAKAVRLPPPRPRVVAPAATYSATAGAPNTPAPVTPIAAYVPKAVAAPVKASYTADNVPPPVMEPVPADVNITVPPTSMMMAALPNVVAPEMEGQAVSQAPVPLPPPRMMASAEARPAYQPSYQPTYQPVQGTAYTPPSPQSSYYAAGIPPMPEARAGECYALVRVPEQFRAVERDYEVRPATERLEAVPARFENATETYVAQEAYEKLEIIPATFKTLTERVELTPPSVRYTTTEAVFENVSEQVIEQPARMVWKRGVIGGGVATRIDENTGEIMCLVEEPAKMKTITRRVLKAPPMSQEVPVPAAYSTVTRRVIDRPAEVRRVLVPEQRATVQIRRQVEPARLNRVVVPGQSAKYTVRELVTPARLEWRSILCQTNTTPDMIRRVQSALRQAGYNPGAENGSLNSMTMAALNKYQRDKGLPEDRFLNIETVRALGIY